MAYLGVGMGIWVFLGVTLVCFWKMGLEYWSLVGFLSAGSMDWRQMYSALTLGNVHGWNFLVIILIYGDISETELSSMLYNHMYTLQTVLDLYSST